MHLTEGRNTGFKKILNALKINSSPLPEFETDEDRTYFISRFFIHKSFQNNINIDTINIKYNTNDTNNTKSHLSESTEVKSHSAFQKVFFVFQKIFV